MDGTDTTGAAARGGAHRTLVAALLAVAIVMGALASAVGGDTDGHRARAARHAPPPLPSTAPRAPRADVSLWVDASHRGRPVPSNFLGLSFEVSDLRQIASYGERGDLVTLLRSLGPGLLRFGGVSADTRVAWADPQTPRPAWTSAVVEHLDLQALAGLARASGWHVILTVGLAHYEPQAAAREVAAAKRALGPWLSAIEVGNEPDAYGRHAFRSEPWTFARYAGEVRAYRRAIARLAPGIPFMGPGVSGSHAFKSWGPGEVREHPVVLTGHHYPLGCHQQPQPSIPELLSPHVRVLEGRSLHRYLAVARRSGIPFRMDEANSVSCGGRAGISNTFASALWATGYIAQSMAAGTSGINFEGNPANCFGYTAVCAPTVARLADGGLNAQPLWYALLMTRGLVGDRPVASTLRARHARNLAVTSFVERNGALQLVICDDEPPGSAPASISVHVGRRFSAASVLELSGPAQSATAGVTLGGRTVGAGGYWSEPPNPPRIPVRGGSLALTLAPSSAQLVTVTPAG
ncbi:MAG TPA: hypothetical protein VHT27_08000 [Solirubrobacteraceae bacterium]|jgi:hypothetical protein|nr:hypothetical protein [Solirubrobacteraceae bacterium]